MRVFFDSSALTKRYVDEAGSDEVDSVWMTASDLGMSVLCYPEVVSALVRLRHEGRISDSRCSKAKKALGEDIAEAFVCDITASVVATAVRVIESGPIRAADALHIACALEWGADLFVSSDARQVEGAKKAGLKVAVV